MSKSITKYNCAIVDKIIPANTEIYCYRKNDEIYHSEWYQNATKEIDVLLKEGYRNFSFTATPLSLLAAEYIAKQKSEHIGFYRARLHFILPNRDFLSFYNINISDYPLIIKELTDITFLCYETNKSTIQKILEVLRNTSHIIFEI
mgnify:CR=1 FL=1